MGIYTISKHQELRDGEDWMSRGEIILTGLTPFTTYSIAVAAVNENGGIGLYSDSVITMTPHCITTYNNMHTKFYPCSFPYR